jgi:hypothetical protein
VGGKEALNLPRRLEPLHDPLSSSGRLMGVFGPVIEPLGTVKLAESRLGWSRVGRVNGRDDDASRPDLRRPSLSR